MSNENYRRKFSLVSDISSIFNIYGLWSEDYNLTYIIYRKYFWVERKPIFIGSVRPIRKSAILMIFMADFNVEEKKRRIFFIN